MANKYLDLLAYFGIGGAHPGGFSLTQALLSDILIKPTDHVLEVGCGTGQTADYISKRFRCEVTGLDNHPVMIEKAKTRVKDAKYPVHIILGDTEQMPFSNDSFDVILAESVICFTTITNTLQEISRVLKPGGKFLMIEMTAEQTPTDELKEETRSIYGITELLLENEWKDRLEQAGFVLLPMEELSEDEAVDLPEMRLSESIDLSLYDVWDQHNEFLMQKGHLVGYRVFSCLKR